MTRRKLRVVVTCEHGGNRIPVPYRALFHGQDDVLASHRGWDPGALPLARALARRVEAPLHYSEVSRLLVELNRSPEHPSLFSDQSRKLSPIDKRRLLARYYYPHRLSIERRVRTYLEEGYRVLHVASHSFSPLLGEEERRADVSWLYDPSRPSESELARQWRGLLAEARPDLCLRFNYPYRGASDGLTTHLRARFRRGYLGIELEVNQSWHFGERGAREKLRRDVVESLAQLLDGTGSKR